MGDIFGGSKAPAKSEYQVKAEANQSAELDRLTKKEDSMKAAMKRRRRGRGTLISGNENGIKNTLG
jgi:hypothetical protein